MTCDLTGPEFEFLKRKLMRGEVVLFLGAGFSANARNASGASLPLGKRLAELLSDAAGFPYNDEPLTNVYQAVKPRIGDNELWRRLQELYRVTDLDDWYHLVSQFVWHRIYTLNIDNLLDVIYQKGGSQKLN